MKKSKKVLTDIKTKENLRLRNERKMKIHNFWNKVFSISKRGVQNICPSCKIGIMERSEEGDIPIPNSEGIYECWKCNFCDYEIYEPVD